MGVTRDPFVGAGSGRLLARPRAAGDSASGRGVGAAELSAGGRPHALGLGKGRDGLLYVPAGYRPGRRLPLVVVLHGAGSSASRLVDPTTRLADEHAYLVLGPDSRGATWDRLRSTFGPDVAFVDRALAFAFARFDVDPAKIALAGFSDGASYALSLGLTNGDLFTHVLAFSPGFSPPGPREGRPAVFVAHGTRDPVLPIDRCSRRIVPGLRHDGYEVRYVEFDGEHRVPPEVLEEGVRWFLSGRVGDDETRSTVPEG